MVSILLFAFTFWIECLFWAFNFLWDTLWDFRAVLIFAVVWIELLFEKRKGLGWKGAVRAMLTEAATYIKAAKRTVFVFGALFIFLTLFVAPAIKYDKLKSDLEKEKSDSASRQSEKAKMEGDLNEAKAKNEDLAKMVEKISKENEALAAENATLHESARVAKETFASPFLEPRSRLREEPQATWFDVLLFNAGQVRVKVLSDETLFYIQGVQSHSESRSTPIFLHPNSTYPYLTQLPKSFRREYKHGKAHLLIVKKFIYTSVYNDDGFLCFVLDPRKPGQFTNSGQPKECDRKAGLAAD